jgi:hypothetical protein
MEELIEIVIGGSIETRDKLIKWAYEMFPGNVYLHEDFPILYFKNQADAEWFVIKWS